MARARRPRSPELQFLYDRYIGDDPQRLAKLEQARADADVAQKVYDLRTQAGLTQRELARRVGTTASVISRLEDADYEGHSLSMLRRIAAAVGQQVEVHFVPLKSGPSSRQRRTANVEATAPTRNRTQASSVKRRPKR